MTALAGAKRRIKGRDLCPGPHLCQSGGEGLVITPWEREEVKETFSNRVEETYLSY